MQTSCHEGLRHVQCDEVRAVLNVVELAQLSSRRFLQRREAGGCWLAYGIDLKILLVIFELIELASCSTRCLSPSSPSTVTGQSEPNPKREGLDVSLKPNGSE